MKENGGSGVEQESAYCQVEWDGVSSVKKSEEETMRSHLTSAQPPSHLLTSYPAIPEIK